MGPGRGGPKIFVRGPKSFEGPEWTLKNLPENLPQKTGWARTRKFIV